MRMPFGERGRGLELAVAASIALAACSEAPHDLARFIELETVTLRARTQVVHTEIRRGGCSGEAVYLGDLRPTVPGSVPPELAAGRWGFAAEARSADCVRFAGDCDDVDLPGPARVDSLLRGFADAPACAARECSAGSCSEARPDAGTDADARVPPPHDAGPDASRVWTDAGPRDGGPPLRPFLPCDGTWEEDLDPYIEVIAGTANRVQVVHDDGICGGCSDEVLQLSAGTTVVARMSFADAFSPLAVRRSGAGSLSIDVCGASYSCDMAGNDPAGFENIPVAECGATPAVTERGECEVRISATGGPVSIRRIDVGCRAAGGAPVVDVRLDGMETLTRPGPASVLLTWSTDQAVSCTGTGTEWSGPQHTSGSVELSGLLPGPHTLTLSCTGPSGAVGSDTARVDVTP